MGREKVTISLSDKCLAIIDYFGETTGLESRSRVIEETIFAISELQKYRNQARYNIQQKKIGSQNLDKNEEMANNLVELVDLTSKVGGIIDRFERFPYVQKVPSKVQNAPPPEHE